MRFPITMPSKTFLQKWLTAFALCTVSIYAYADIFDIYRNPDGSTKWQWIANSALSLLIITLLIVAIFLLVANSRARRINRELTDIKATLEDRVARRTES